MSILPTDELVIHRAGNDYRSAVSTLPVADFTLSDVLTNGNLADSFQAIRFKTSEVAPDPDAINPDPNILSDGIGSAHRSLYSAWTAFVPGTGGMHSDANASYFVNYLLGEDASPLALAKVNANYGFSFYQSSALTGGSSVGVDFGHAGINVSGKFTVDHEGSVTATEFIGDGSQLTNLPLTGYATEVYVTGAIDAIPPTDLSLHALLNDNTQSITALEFIGDGSQLTNLPLTGYATETYVDEAIEEIGDVLVLKDSLDFTTTPAPGVFAVGDVYANTGTGTPDVSWSLSGDVAPGELYGRGETQWALIGSSDVDLSEYAKLTDSSQSVTALEFIGDGSKLTNLPSSSSSISEVLAEGNTADPGQSLHFRVNAGDLPPFTRGSIDVDAGSGLRLGGLVSYYTINGSFTLDTDSGATDLTGCQRRMSADGDYFFAETPGGDSMTAGTGVSGLFFNGDDGHFSINNGSGVLRIGDYDAPILSIEARTYDGTSSITAGEFIGDGSKLTNLPGGGGAVGINQVLAEGNTADPAQSLHFNISGGDLPPIVSTSASDTIDFQGSAGLRLGGLVSYYHINEPFTVDTGSGDVTEFQYATRQMTTMEDAYFTNSSEGDVFTQVGLWGIRYRDKGTWVDITQNRTSLNVQDKDDSSNNIFHIEANYSSGTSYIKAGEFIGDGSKLTLTSPNGTVYSLTVADDGTLSTTAV